MEDYSERLCNEKHGAVNRRLEKNETNVDKLFGSLDNLISAINGKFTKVFIMFITVLLTIIGGLVVTIVTGR